MGFYIYCPHCGEKMKYNGVIKLFRCVGCNRSISRNYFDVHLWFKDLIWEY